MKNHANLQDLDPSKPTDIVFVGFGFHVAGEYTCRFTSGDQSIEHPAIQEGGLNELKCRPNSNEFAFGLNISVEVPQAIQTVQVTIRFSANSPEERNVNEGAIMIVTIVAVLALLSTVCMGGIITYVVKRNRRNSKKEYEGLQLELHNSHRRLTYEPNDSLGPQSNDPFEIKYTEIKLLNELGRGE